MASTITPEQYQQLWDTMDVLMYRDGELHSTVGAIFANKHRYEDVSKLTGVPWYVIASIHYRESSLNFKRHLHNGDPLTARTTHVPAGRPFAGNPPFAWEESAVDALTMRGLNKPRIWSTPEMLKQLEGFNGLGYQKRGINTPYLWAGTNHYTAGKYIADGKFDATVKDKQLGCAVIIKELLS